MNPEKSSSVLPCVSCPWRIDQDASAIPRYNHEKACKLMNTVGDGDAIRPIMACHGSTDDDMRACNGYLARAGWSNITVRLLLSHGKIANPTTVMEACSAAGIKLHTDYVSVLKKLEQQKEKKGRQNA